MNIPQPPKNPNTPKPITPNGCDKKRAAIIIGLIALVIGVVIAVVVYKNSSGTGGGSSSGDDSDSFNVATWIPIWVAIWIPIMIANKKKQEENGRNKEITDKHKKIIIILVIGLALAMIFGVIALIAQK